MKTLAKLTASVVVVLLSGGLALADCVDDRTTASTAEAGKTPPIAKDGSKAPLETEPSDQAKAEAVQPQKDGGNMPLSTSEGDHTNDNIATSQQDVEAQQEGEKTAAAKADRAC